MQFILPIKWHNLVFKDKKVRKHVKYHNKCK